MEAQANKSYNLKYCGQTLIHSYFTESMLPWIAAEINLNSVLCDARITVHNDGIDVEKTTVSCAVEKNTGEISEIPCNDLITFNDDDCSKTTGTDNMDSRHANCITEQVFQCTYAQIVHVTVILHQHSPHLAILFRESKESPILSHMFYSGDQNLMFEVLNAIKTKISQKRKNGMHCDMTSYIGWNGEDTDSVRFEVMFLGVANLKNPNPAHSLIDEAVAEYQNKHSGNVKMQTSDSTNYKVVTEESSLPSLNSLMDDSREGAWQMMRNLDSRQRCNSVDQAQKPAVRRRQRHSSEPSTYSNNLHKSRIRLFQIGKDSIKLFCPTKSIRPFEIEFSNISQCMQGIVNRDHFGIIANKIDHFSAQRQAHATNDSKHDDREKKFACYIYKCSEEYVCEEIMQGIKQAFLTCLDNASPMRDYDLLCKDVNAVSVQDALAVVKQSMRKLSDGDVEIIKAQLLELKPQTQRDKLASVMGSLRHVYEIKQVEHIKEIRKTQPFEQQPALTVTKTFDNIKSKAKNSFESLLQRGKKKMQELQLDAEHFSERNIISPVDKLKFFADTFSHSLPSTPQKHCAKNNEPVSETGSTLGKSKRSLSADIDLATDENKELFYRKIFKDIASTSSTSIDGKSNALPSHKMKIVVEKEIKKSPQEIRELWKWAIKQQVLLQKINQVDKTQLAALKTSPLQYIDLSPIPQDMVVIWDAVLQMSLDEKRNLDDKVLCAAVKTGILSSERGRVWKLFRYRWQDSNESGCESIIKQESYEMLLENLTPYQHAILIDIGRTFPSHPLYSQQLGTGQLSLFNVLKAYSLLDEEVGYCQGLSFIAGVLLMHTCIEREAYELLCCLMYDMGCRNMYLPDMKGMKLAVYKVTRLLYDVDQDLYKCFEKHQVSMMLVATPWFLTMFASSFPLHFVARVFDMVFFEGSSALFKIAVSLLQQHKNKIMECEDFEDIVNYIRSQIPESNVQAMKEVVQKAMTMNIKSMLHDYEVEYRVLQDEGMIAKQEMDGIKSLAEDIQCLQQVNQKVTESNCDLLQQLHEAQQKVASLQKMLKHNSAMQP